MVSVAFLGSHGLGADCLDALVDHPGIEIPIVVTYPPDHDGWWDGSVRRRANDHGLTVEPIANERAVFGHEIDYLLSVYYPNVLGPDLLSHPAEAPINLHQAELPRYRGSNVFSHAIMNARADDHWRYGTTVHVMEAEVDAGDVVERRFVDIEPDDTARSLYERTREASLELFEDLLPAIASREVHEGATPQEAFDGPRYFYTKESLDGLKEVPMDGLRDPDERIELYDRIRALDFPPHEPAYVTVDGEKLYLTATGYQDLFANVTPPSVSAVGAGEADDARDRGGDGSALDDADDDDADTDVARDRRGDGVGDDHGADHT